MNKATATDLPDNVGSAGEGCQVKHPALKVGFQLECAAKAIGPHPFLYVRVALHQHEKLACRRRLVDSERM